MFQAVNTVYMFFIRHLLHILLDVCDVHPRKKKCWTQKGSFWRCYSSSFWRLYKFRLYFSVKVPPRKPSRNRFSTAGILLFQLQIPCFGGKKSLTLRILAPQRPGYFEDPKTPLLCRFFHPSIGGSKWSLGYKKLTCLILFDGSIIPLPHQRLWTFTRPIAPYQAVWEVETTWFRWWLQWFLMFTPTCGKMIQFDLHILFSKWVLVQPPTKLYTWFFFMAEP